MTNPKNEGNKHRWFGHVILTLVWLCLFVVCAVVIGARLHEILYGCHVASAVKAKYKPVVYAKDIVIGHFPVRGDISATTGDLVGLCFGKFSRFDLSRMWFELHALKTETFDRRVRNEDACAETIGRISCLKARDAG